MRIERLAIIAVLLGLLAGCGSGESAAPSGAVAELTVQRSAYTLRVPEVWKDVTADHQTKMALDLFMVGGPADGNPDVFSVRLTPIAPKYIPWTDAALTDLEAQKDGFNTKDVTESIVAPRVTVDGVPSIHFSKTQSGQKAEQVVTYHDRQLVLVTFGFGPETTAEHRDSVVKEILAGWKWKPAPA